MSLITRNELIAKYPIKTEEQKREERIEASLEHISFLLTQEARNGNTATEITHYLNTEDEIVLIQHIQKAGYAVFRQPATTLGCKLLIKWDY